MMNRVLGLTLAALLPLAGCATAPAETENGYLEELPEGLAEAAAPGQNMHAIRIQPDDGCYWYEHVGPVETTLLPLLTRDGRPICSRPREEA